MSFFDKFLKENIKMNSVAKGKSIEIEKVPDPVFSEKMMGDGIAFVLDHDTIYAPCDGKILFVADTLHAVGIQSDSGVELMIHIGLDTVNLKGEGFRKLISKNHVKQGDPLIKIDLDLMHEKEVNLTTMMIITNSDKYEITDRVFREVTANDWVLSVDKR